MQKFTAGTPVREVITLRNMNEIADAVNRVNAFLPAAPRSAPDPFRSDIVRVSVSSKFPKFAAVTFSASLITSPVNSSDPIPTLSAYQFAGEDPSAVTFGILQEPANPGEYARALISGVSFARLVVKDSSHKYAVLQSSDDPAFPGLLESAETGPVRILAKSSDTLDGYPVAAVLLAATAQQPAPPVFQYDGPFAIHVEGSGDYWSITCNGGLIWTPTECHFSYTTRIYGLPSTSKLIVVDRYGGLTAIDESYLYDNTEQATEFWQTHALLGRYDAETRTVTQYHFSSIVFMISTEDFIITPS